MKFNLKMIHGLSIVFLMLPLSVLAADVNTEPTSTVKPSAVISHDPMSSNYLIQLVIGLIVVLLCIVALAWFAKKMNRYRFLADDSLKIIGGLSMGARERVVLLQVGEDQLLLGVSAGQINTLHVLGTPIETAASNPDKSIGKSFSDKLKTMMTDANAMKIKQQADQAKKNKQ